VRHRRPGWLGAALAGSGGALAGVLAALAFGGGESTEVRTITVTTRGDPGQTLIAKGPVPNLVGRRLDRATELVRRAGFVAVVEGGGIAGVLRRAQWRVSDQDPSAGGAAELGSAVRLRVERR
jgi:hypothetical protein